MTSETTYSLTIDCGSDMHLKSAACAKLDAMDVTYITGQVSEITADPEPDLEGLFTAFGGDSAPMSVYSYDQEYLRALGAELEGSFSNLVVSLGQFSTESWQEGWKQSFKPIVTDRFIVYPPWEDQSDLHLKFGAGRIGIEIEPGMAFGTGQHETTQLCLKALEHAHETHKFNKIMDVGCGSGILSIAAGRLTGAKLFGCDIDADSIAATKENGRRNQVGVDVRQGSLDAIPEEGFDLVFANILKPVILDMLPELCKSCAPSGLLVLSGFLVEDVDDIVAAAKSMVLQSQTSANDWACVVLARDI